MNKNDKKPLRVLILEDSDKDKISLFKELEKNYRVQHVCIFTAKEMKEQLGISEWDIIIADNDMQSFDSFQAIEILKNSGIDLPLIIVSGTMLQNESINAMILGANDYVPKNDLSRLLPAINRELEQAALRKERKKALSDLIKSEECFRILFENAPIMILGFEKNGCCTLMNSEFEKVFGWTIYDINTQKEPFALLFPDQNVRNEAVEAFITNPDNTFKEWHPLTRDRKELTTLWASYNLPDETVISIGYDITSRKRAREERIKLEAQLFQAQKMESVGRLAGGVAHDFNNMLAVILGHSELALKKINPSHPLHTDLQEIQQAAQRSTNLTRQLLAFARKEAITPKVLDLNETIESMLKMLRMIIGEDIDLIWLPGKEVWPVKMDPSQIDQILANLCINARDAIVGIGSLTIETDTTLFEKDYHSAHFDFEPGEYAKLTVSDNGCGMDRETLANIFEPFFTTKELGKGIGLGLATVYGIVKQNKGFINVSSEPGQGTTITIYLPRYSGETDETQEKGAEDPVMGGHEIILLVEDEPAILKMTKNMLEGLGYTVLATTSPGEAIRLAEDHANEKIHLLITDVVMPEMNGAEMTRKLLSVYPNLKSLFMSGYTADIIAHHGVLDEGLYFLRKPFSLKELAVKVREVLDG